jgi:flagellar motor switch/type III secretory pathway protein FliN
LCGNIRGVVPETAACAALETAVYFEVRLCDPVRVAIGFALNFEPAQQIGPTLTLDDLSDVELRCSIEVARGGVAVPVLARLEPGSVLPLETALGAEGRMQAGGAALALGTCGSRGERAAFMLTGERAERSAA